LQIIEEVSGTQLDPEVVLVFKEVFKKFLAKKK
jgi:HD-GYP domain-containing protein (c-di-GMP phosphodiesterase class II)